MCCKRNWILETSSPHLSTFLLCETRMSCNNASFKYECNVVLYQRHIPALLACKTGVIFQASGGKHGARVTRDGRGARPVAPRARLVFASARLKKKRQKKLTPVLQATALPTKSDPILCLGGPRVTMCVRERHSNSGPSCSKTG